MNSLSYSVTLATVQNNIRYNDRDVSDLVTEASYRSEEVENANM